MRNITKIVSGQDEGTLDIIARTYESVVSAGVHLAPSILVAEAAKVIENTQRDLNVALMNELAIIFDRMGIDTGEVLAAAGTKWNFLPFSPGLVGGHCIGVDPYYLTYKAEKIGYNPQVILAGRRINDEMGKYVAHRTIKEMIHAGNSIPGSGVTILGLTFKEDCPDLRNSKVIDIVQELLGYGIEVQVSDPIADPSDVFKTFGIRLTPLDKLKPVSTLLLAVAHKAYRGMEIDQLMKLFDKNPVLMDVKGIFNRKECKEAGLHHWRL